MKEAAAEPAAKGKGISKSEGANDGKKRFEVKKVHHGSINQATEAKR